jgi:hypothetical protein
LVAGTIWYSTYVQSIPGFRCRFHVCSNPYLHRELPKGFRAPEIAR